MDMKTILSNMDEAVSGNRPAVASNDKNGMKSILESFYSVNTKEDKKIVNEAVSITSDSPDELAQLLKVMGGGAAPEAPSHSDQEMDMHMMRQIMSDPEPEEESACGSMEDSDVEEDYINEPDEDYRDHKFMTKDLSGGINREKKAYKAAQPGDNAMAVESIKKQLWAALQEKKSCSSKRMKAKEGEYKNDAQRKAVHAAKSKKKNESDVDEAHGNSKVYDKCWDGYEKVPGKKRGEPGSCRKK